MPKDVEAEIARAVASKLDSGTQWLLRREIAKLPRVLPSGEEIAQLAQGRHKGATGLIVVTDRRLIFFEQGVSHQRVEDLPYVGIDSIEAAVSIVASELTIACSQGEVTIDRVYPKDRTREIAGYVRDRISPRTGSGASEAPTRGR